MVRTLRALAQMQDTLALDTIEAYCAHRFHDVRQEAYFALGQLGYGTTSRRVWAGARRILVERFGSETSVKHRVAVVDALGKAGDGECFPLIKRGLADPEEQVAGAAALAASRLALRGFTGDTLNAALTHALTHSSTDVRWKAVCAFMRIRDPRYGVNVLPLLNDPDERVRMDAARALGAMSLKASAEPRLKDIQNALIERATSDTSWQVRVNAVAALGTFPFSLDDLKKIYFLIAFEGLRDRSEHVRITAIRSMARSYAGDVKDWPSFLQPFSERFLTQASSIEQVEILQSLITMGGGRVLESRGIRSRMKRLLHSKHRYVRAGAVAAVGSIASPRVVPYLKEALLDSFSLVQNYAIDGLLRSRSNEGRELVINALDTQNPWTLALAAYSLASDTTVLKDRRSCDLIAERIVATASELRDSLDIDSKATLFDALGELGSAHAVSFLKGFLTDSLRPAAEYAAKNLKKITGSDYSDSVRMRRSENRFDVQEYIRIKAHKPSAEIETDAGIIRLGFYVDEAPFTVISFIRLAERGYFDGLYFHRVVPNFVIQAGDPSGTGWGGPGYTIRSEFGARTYDRGTVGMASAGRDTEGSQWFITHSSQPHLDGRYTVFAQVTEGMEVVDRIQIGNRIRTVRIVWY
jgi:cyclophilin family peptidyl-prolyl cis-trans isomerase/HEAT repeat protein